MKRKGAIILLSSLIISTSLVFVGCSNDRNVSNTENEKENITKSQTISKESGDNSKTSTIRNAIEEDGTIKYRSYSMEDFTDALVYTISFGHGELSEGFAGNIHFCSDPNIANYASNPDSNIGLEAGIVADIIENKGYFMEENTKSGIELVLVENKKELVTKSAGYNVMKWVFYFKVQVVDEEAATKNYQRIDPSKDTFLIASWKTDNNGIRDGYSITYLIKSFDPRESALSGKPLSVIRPTETYVNGTDTSTDTKEGNLSSTEKYSELINLYLNDGVKAWDNNRNCELGVFDSLDGACVNRFATVDFDGDSLKEVFLETDNGVDGGWLVIYLDGDSLHCQSFDYRAITCLQDNGIFSFSNGASSYGYSFFEKKDNFLEQRVLAEVDGENDLYFVNGEEVTNDEFVVATNSYYGNDVELYGMSSAEDVVTVIRQ